MKGFTLLEALIAHTKAKRLLTGFTLVELLVVIGIFGLMIAGILGVFNTGILSIGTASLKLDVQPPARIAMDWLIKDMRQTDSGHISVQQADRIVFQRSTGVDSWGNTLEYKLVTDDQDASKKMIARIDSANGAVNKFKNIQSFALNYSEIGSNLIAVTITAGKTYMGRAVTFSLYSKVKLRK